MVFARGSVVSLISSAGVLLDVNDDGGSGDTNSRLIATLPDDGVYHLLVTVHPFDVAADGGVYEVTVREVPEARDVVREREAFITLGTTERSTLDADRPETGNWSFEGRSGQTVEVEVASDEFDTVVSLISSAGVLLDVNDDGGSGDTNSRLIATLPDDGVYHLLVTVHPFDVAADGGVYEVTVREVPEARDVVREREAFITLGTTERSTLDADRPETGNWSFEGRSGQTVEVEVASDEFDTVVGLISPAGVLLDVNDDGGSGDTNSRLIATLPDDGVYHLLVTVHPFDVAADGGVYEITVSDSEWLVAFEATERSTPTARGAGVV